jgi:hypothetical protein
VSTLSFALNHIHIQSHINFLQTNKLKVKASTPGSLSQFINLIYYRILQRRRIVFLHHSARPHLILSLLAFAALYALDLRLLSKVGRLEHWRLLRSCIAMSSDQIFSGTVKRIRSLELLQPLGKLLIRLFFVTHVSTVWGSYRLRLFEKLFDVGITTCVSVHLPNHWAILLLRICVVLPAARGLLLLYFVLAFFFLISSLGYLRESVAIELCRAEDSICFNAHFARTRWTKQLFTGDVHLA